MTKIKALIRSQRSEFEDIHHLVQTLIADRLPDLTQTMIDLALGLWVEETVRDSTGEAVRRVYSKEPNFFALQYLTNRQMGTPTMKREETSITGTPQDFASLMQEKRAAFEAKTIGVEYKVLEPAAVPLTGDAEAATDRAERETQQPEDDRARLLRRLTGG